MLFCSHHGTHFRCHIHTYYVVTGCSGFKPYAVDTSLSHHFRFVQRHFVHIGHYNAVPQTVRLFQGVFHCLEAAFCIGGVGNVTHKRKLVGNFRIRFLRQHLEEQVGIGCKTACRHACSHVHFLHCAIFHVLATVKALQKFCAVLHFFHVGAYLFYSFKNSGNYFVVFVERTHPVGKIYANASDGEFFKNVLQNFFQLRCRCFCNIKRHYTHAVLFTQRRTQTLHAFRLRIFTVYHHYERLSYAFKFSNGFLFRRNVVTAWNVAYAAVG